MNAFGLRGYLVLMRSTEGRPGYLMPPATSSALQCTNFLRRENLLRGRPHDERRRDLGGNQNASFRAAHCE
jgi:hypothetical protein